MFKKLCFVFFAAIATAVIFINAAFAEEVTISSQTTLSEDMHISGNLKLNAELNLNGHKLIVDGDLIQNSGKVLNVGSGSLEVGANYYLRRGTFNAGEGRTEIGGGFFAESEAHKGANAQFVMQKENGYVLVNGDFVVDMDTGSGVYGKITAGTLELRGNFTQRSSYADSSYPRYGFAAAGTHKVILSGKGEQLIAFEDSGYSKFNQVENKNILGVRFLSWAEYKAIMKQREEEKANTVAKDNYGENITWRLDKSGVLYVSGTGEMADYYNDITAIPWYSYSMQIKEVVVGEGITKIGSWAFEGLYNLEKVTLPSTLKRIESSAFMSCFALKEITIPANIEYIEDCVFLVCSELGKIIF